MFNFNYLKFFEPKIGFWIALKNVSASLKGNRGQTTINSTDTDNSKTKGSNKTKGSGLALTHKNMILQDRTPVFLSTSSRL